MINKIKQLFRNLIFLFKERRNIIKIAKKRIVFKGENLIIGKNYTLNDAAIIKNNNGTLIIGDNFTLGIGANLLTYGGSIQIGDNSLVNNYSIIYGNGGVKIGNNTQIAAHCTIIPANRNYSFINIPIQRQGESRAGIKIGDDVWIGANSVILDGVKIGNGCIIGAGSVVTKSIPENSIAFGNPAKVTGKRKDFEDKRI